MTIKQFSYIFLSLVILLLSGFGHAALVVIVHPGNSITQLSRDQVVDIYMGRKSNFPDGRVALTIDLSPDSPQRAAYYQLLVGKTVSQVNAYWARLLFTGRATPPRVLADPEAVLKAVRENKDAIGYVDSKDLDGRVKVVFQLN